MSTFEARMEAAGAEVDAEAAQAVEPEASEPEVEVQAEKVEDESAESADLSAEDADDDSDDEVVDASKKPSRYSRTVQKLKETNKDLTEKFAQSQQALEQIYQRQQELEAKLAASIKEDKKKPETPQEIAEDIFESKTVELKEQLKQLKAEKEQEKMKQFMAELDNTVTGMWPAEAVATLPAADQKVFKNAVKDFIASGLLHWKGGSQESVAGAFRAVVKAAARMEVAQSKVAEKAAIEKSKAAPKPTPSTKASAAVAVNTAVPDLNSQQVMKFYPANNAVDAWDKAFSDGFKNVPKSFFK